MRLLLPLSSPKTSSASNVVLPKDWWEKREEEEEEEGRWEKETERDAPLPRSRFRPVIWVLLVTALFFGGWGREEEEAEEEEEGLKVEVGERPGRVVSPEEEEGREQEEESGRMCAETSKESTLSIKSSSSSGR